MAKKRVIISFILIAVLAFGIICMSGITLAINQVRNDSTGTITTAGIDLSAKAKNVAVYTAVKTSEEGDDTFVYNGNVYKYEQSNLQSEGSVLFSNHRGSVKVEDQNVTIDNIMPGDKVEFDIEVSSASNIAFNYRAELYVNSEQGDALLNQLNFSAGRLGLLRMDVNRDDGDDEMSEAVLTDYTEWTKISASQENIENVKVSIELPLTADTGSGEKLDLYYVVRGEQNTEMQGDIASVTSPMGEPITFRKLYTNDLADPGAIDYALRNGIDTVTIIGNNIVEEGTVRINRAMSIIGVADGQGNYPTVNGARFIVEDGASLTIRNVNFDGASYIDVSGAMGLTLENCIVDTAPVALYDETAREFVENPAFVVSATSLTPVKLNITKSKFSSLHGSAINLRSPFTSGSIISDNEFGTAQKVYDGSAVMVFNGAANLDVASQTPVIEVSKNVIYGDRAFSLGSGAGTNEYLVISTNNTAHGMANKFASGVTGGGRAYAALTDNDSTADGAALTCADIAYENLMFGGVDVTLNGLNLIASGRVALSSYITAADFYDRYTVGLEQLQEGDIVFYTNGTN